MISASVGPLNININIYSVFLCYVPYICMYVQGSSFTEWIINVPILALITQDVNKQLARIVSGVGHDDKNDCKVQGKLRKLLMI